MLWISLICPSKAMRLFNLVRVLGSIHQQFLWNTITKHASVMRKKVIVLYNQNSTTKAYFKAKDH
jgi:hypothetical protein